MIIGTAGLQPERRIRNSRDATNMCASLDRAVWAAYGWTEPPEETDDETTLARLLALNLERADTAG